MQGSKYNDTTSVLQVIGCLFKKPELLQEDGRYFFREEDFVNDLHRVIFGSMLHLSNGGAESFNAKIIEDYLQNHPKSLAIYKQNHGAEWISEVIDAAEVGSFEYNYQRMKKMTLLRAYDQLGIDVDWIYDPDNVLDVKKKQEQEINFDTLTLNEIADLVENRVLELHDMYIDHVTDDSVSIGDDLDEFMEELAQTPDMGLPLYGDLINTVTRGCRKGKFYLRSAPTGVGKSRTMMADACYLACDEFFDLDKNEWVNIGPCQPTVFISTELELSEVRTMALAFLSGVNEDHILTGKYNAVNNEWNRVKHATEVLKKAKLRVETIPDFSLKDIENIIKRNIRLYKVQYVFFDYIHTSMKILEEVTRRSGGIKLREDNILFLLSVKLKEICVAYDVFLLSSTQLNGDYRTADTPDQNLLRGAKAIADKIDWGAILLDVNTDELSQIENLVAEKGCCVPNVKLSIYKNRRGKYVRCYIWMIADKGTCRFEPVFATDYNYNYIPMVKSKIHVTNDIQEPWDEE